MNCESKGIMTIQKAVVLAVTPILQFFTVNSQILSVFSRRPFRWNLTTVQIRSAGCRDPWPIFPAQSDVHTTWQPARSSEEGKKKNVEFFSFLFRKRRSDGWVHDVIVPAANATVYRQPNNLYRDDGSWSDGANKTPHGVADNISPHVVVRSGG